MKKLYVWLFSSITVLLASAIMIDTCTDKFTVTSLILLFLGIGNTIASLIVTIKRWIRETK